MEIRICKTSAALGESAAKYVAKRLNDIIAEKGYARIVLSTGASQFETLDALTRENVNWSVVDMFHLDEYVNLPITHMASFRKYLQERFVDRLPMPLRSVNFVDGTPEGIAQITKKLREDEIDIGLIGIGENTHIAFNDPPADFDTKEAYIIVNLNDTCKKQQVGEGWFATVDDVPKQAVSMTVYQILQCEKIVSCVPFAVKADAVRKTLEQDANNLVPATVMKGHDDFTLFVDADSYAEVDESLIRPAPGKDYTIEKR